MRKIWKFRMDSHDTQIQVPGVHTFLSIQARDNDIFLYFEVDPATDPVMLHIVVYETGHPIEVAPSDRKFLGTVTTHAGFLVWHAFLLPDW